MGIKNAKKGFTLLEATIYIALFSILIVGVFTIAFQMTSGADSLRNKSITQEESDFVIHKIEWSLSGMSTSTTSIKSPPTSAPYASSGILSIEKTSFGKTIPVVIMFDEPTGRIMMSTDDAPPVELTTENVQVQSLTFALIPLAGTRSWGIRVNLVIDDVSTAIIKYPRI